MDYEVEDLFIIVSSKMIIYSSTGDIISSPDKPYLTITNWDGPRDLGRGDVTPHGAC
jgi:hypothetical protein